MNKLATRFLMMSTTAINIKVKVIVLYMLGVPVAELIVSEMNKVFPINTPLLIRQQVQRSPL